MFVNKLAVAGCIVLSDGFASAWSKGRGTFCLYSMKKREYPVLWLIVLFIANSVNVSASNHANRGFLWMCAYKICSNVRLVRSLCPSLWGWNAVEALVLVPRIHHNSCQRWAVNLGSRSWISSFGMPKNLTMFSNSIFAIYAADSLSSPMVQGMRCINLVRQSTMVRIQLKPHSGGKLVTKSNRSVAITGDTARAQLLTA